MASELHARSLKLLRERGWEPGTVERRMAAFRPSKVEGEKGTMTPFGRTVDLWGWVDLIAFHPETLLLAYVQACSANNITEHKHTLLSWPQMPRFLEMPRVQVQLHVWRKPKKGLRSRWMLDAQLLKKNPTDGTIAWHALSL